MNRTFDFYEYAAFIIPGAVLTLGVMVLFPEARALFSKEGGVTFGDLGIFVITAYAVGQLIQGIGNFIESVVYWPFGGKASERALAGKFLSPEQYKRVMEALKADAKIARDISMCSAVEYPAIVGMMYGRVLASGKVARLDAFNGSYGLMRGLAATFAVLLVLAVVLAKDWVVIGVLAFVASLALQRMNRYNSNYTKELFTQYLLLPAEPTIDLKKTPAV